MSTARDHIIQTTCDLLELQGYHATGMNQIIKESGSPKGSLYYYFPGGKEELAAEAVKYAGEITLSRIRDNLALIPDAAEAIYTFITTIAHFVELSGFRAGGPITIVAMESAASSDVLRQVCQGIYDGWQTVFADKLKSSHFDDARAARIAALIIASIEGGVILCRTSRSQEPLKNVAGEIRLLLQHTR
jgi:TetR/AcrR family transcriptional regulator, lmrAB and yxaGH operons repressor